MSYAPLAAGRFMTRLVLHIGSHKAGSTAIQSACARNTPLLAKAGVLYPTELFPNYPQQHSELTQLVRSGDEAAIAGFADKIAALLQTGGESTLFLSGEDLSSLARHDEIFPLAEALRTVFDEIRVVLVIRRKADYVMSHFNHFLRHTARPVTAEDFRASIKFSPRETLAAWRSAFGTETVIPFAYDSGASQQPFLRRFFDQILGIGLSDDVLRSSSGVNRSFDMLSAAFVNEVLKPLPSFTLTDANIAYLLCYQGLDGRLPLFEQDLRRFLDGLFPDDHWALEELPGLLDPPSPAAPLDAETARAHLTATAEFFANLRTRLIDSVETGDRPVRRSEIVEGYRLLLGRVPSSEEIVNILRAQKSGPQLRQMFVDSQEFRRKYRERLNVAPLDLPPLEVETTASETDMACMAAHVGRHWTRLGTERPHWSVWSEPHFAGRVTPVLEDEFLKTGQRELDGLLMTLARSGRTPESFARMVEFGCGIGRLTLSAAQRFREIVAIDISETHLAHARRRASDRGLSNVTWVHRAGLDPLQVGPYDLWYSRIVLQHNPPPLIDRFLREGLDGLAPFGIAVFQLPTYAVNYRFSTAQYLASVDSQPEIEMHCLPQSTLLQIIADTGCRLREIREDNSVDIPRLWVSNTVVVERPA